MERRYAVNDKARECLIHASKAYQKFVAGADDLDAWLPDKTKIAGNESNRDLTNLPRKLQKHKAFECELRSNGRQMRIINKYAEAL